ncbi:MAG: hypothetical protein AAFN77_10625 [Planctomycetota bacterium]
MRRFRFSLGMLLATSMVAGLLVAFAYRGLTTRQSDAIPVDILNRISEEYGHWQQGNEAQDIVESVFAGTLNVGKDQYARAILYLADGDLEELKRLAEIPEDPRNTLYRLSKTSFQPSIPFDQQPES